MQRRNALFLALLLPVCALSAAETAPTTPAGAAAHAAKDQPSLALQIDGAVTAPRSFDLASLQKLATQNSGPVDVVCASGATVATGFEADPRGVGPIRGLGEVDLRAGIEGEEVGDVAVAGLVFLVVLYPLLDGAVGADLNGG